MNRGETRQTDPPHIAAQVAASWSSLDAAIRAGNLDIALDAQDRAFLGAIREMQVPLDFVGTPEHILGSSATKHGEIAEQVHVAVNRARDVLFGNAPTATFEGVGRSAPIDYLSDGVGVQSKYYNGLYNSLGGVFEHASKYPGFVAGEEYYHIPRDQYGQLEELNQTGRIEGLSASSSNAIRNRLESLEHQTGRSADDLIRPGEAEYSEVQQGRVHETLRDREDELRQANERLKDVSRAEHGPSLSGLGKAAGIGATVGAGVGLTQAVWVKYHAERKNPFRGDFTVDDWKDVGVSTGKGSGGGVIAGGALYLLTNSSQLSAPAVGAFVSGLMGIGSLLGRYHAGEIDGSEFVDMSQMVALDAAIVGLASMTGQVAIPVPVLGAFVGSIAGKFVASAITGGLGESEAELIAHLHAHEQSALEHLDRACEAEIQRLDGYFGNLERLAEVAFDDTVNTRLRLEASVEFAERVGVCDDLILRTTVDLDKFMAE